MGNLRIKGQAFLYSLVSHASNSRLEKRNSRPYSTRLSWIISSISPLFINYLS